MTREAAHDRISKLWRLAANNSSQPEAAQAARASLAVARLGWFRYTISAGVEVVVMDRVTHRVRPMRLKLPLPLTMLVTVAPPHAVFGVGSPHAYFIRAPLSGVSISLR